MSPNLTISRSPKMATACAEFVYLKRDNTMAFRSVGGETFPRAEPCEPKKVIGASAASSHFTRV